MSDKPLNDDINALDAEAAEANAEHGLDSRPAQDAGDDLAPLDAVIAERDEWKDRALRVAAEMENLKRRSETQQNDARAFAIQRFAKDLLGVADNLERALMAAPKDAEGATAGLVTGLELTQKALLQAFDANGLKRVAPQAGESFNPHLHQAMMEQPSETVPGGSFLGPTGPFEAKGPVGMAKSSKVSKNIGKQAQLWVLTEELTGVRFKTQLRDAQGAGPGRRAPPRRARRRRRRGSPGSGRSASARRRRGGSRRPKRC